MAKLAVFRLAMCSLVLAGGCGRPSVPAAPPVAPAAAPAAAPAVAPAPESAGGGASTGAGWALDRSTFDPKADPCSDFYRYVCGGFAASAPIPPDRGSVEWKRDLASATNSRALQNLLSGRDASTDGELGRLRTFFASCMMSGDAADRAGDAALASWLSRIDRITKRTDVAAVLRELHAIGVNVWFRYAGEADRGDRTRFRGEIHQGSLGARVFTTTGPAGDQKREAYRAHIQRMFELAGIRPAQARADARAAFELEAKLQAVRLAPGDEYDPEISEHPLTPKALAALAPHVDWTAYLAMVGHPADRGLNVTSPAYLQQMDRIIATQPIASLRASLRWALLYSLAPALPARLADERYRFTAAPGRQRGPRADECQLETVKAMGVELSRQFSNRFIGEEVRDRATEVAERVRGEMATAAKAIGWLSPAARAASAEKLDLLSLKIGFPDAWPTTGAFELHADRFLENVVAARRFEQHRAWARAGEARRRDSWEMMVWPNAAPGMAAARLTIANGFPDAFSNSIVMTAAALQSPMFDADAPVEVRYAGFGFVVAHEIVHRLETHMFDAYGELRDVWTPADVQAREARAACVVNQADQFVAFEDAHLNGTQTVSENIADLGGLAHAYDAMTRAVGPRLGERGADGFTPAQRFFVAYAQHWCAAERPEAARDSLHTDSHAPARFRVNGPLANLPAFATAFSCTRDAAMVRPEASRCVLW